MSTVCICGRLKEDPKRRYCAKCAARHLEVMRNAHLGKGTGRRRKRKRS